MPPAPNPNARRRNVRIGTNHLPAGGRPGTPPPWPLLTPPPDEATGVLELALWGRLWRLPQAVAWERDHAFREVGMYVRWSIRAESLDRLAAAEARQMGDRLGLNPKALRALMWEIPSDEVAQQRATRDGVSTAAKGTARSRRVRAVEPLDVDTADGAGA